MNRTTRPTTEDRPNPDGSRTIHVAACCNRCGTPIGDVFEEEIWEVYGGGVPTPIADAAAIIAVAAADDDGEINVEHYIESFRRGDGFVLNGIRYSGGDQDTVNIAPVASPETDRWAECPRCNLAFAEALAREHQLTELVRDFAELASDADPEQFDCPDEFATWGLPDVEGWLIWRACRLLGVSYQEFRGSPSPGYPEPTWSVEGAEKEVPRGTSEVTA